MALVIKGLSPVFCQIKKKSLHPTVQYIQYLFTTSVDDRGAGVLHRAEEYSSRYQQIHFHYLHEQLFLHYLHEQLFLKSLYSIHCNPSDI